MSNKINLSEKQTRRFMKLAGNGNYADSFLKEQEITKKTPEQPEPQPYNGDTSGVGTPYSEANDKKTEVPPEKETKDPLDVPINEDVNELEDKLYNKLMEQFDIEDEEDEVDVEMGGDDSDPFDLGGEEDFNSDEEDMGGEPAELDMGTGELSVSPEDAKEVATVLMGALSDILPGVDIAVEEVGVEVEPEIELPAEDALPEPEIETPEEEVEDAEEEEMDDLFESKIKDYAKRLVMETMKSIKTKKKSK